MKKQAVLFVLRLFFYFSVIIFIYLHPGITVTFDTIGIVQWFFIIPIQALIAYLPLKILNTPRGFKMRSIYALGSLFVLSVIAGGFSPDALTPFAAGLVSFVLTYLLFHHPKWAKASALEPFFLAWVCLRLLALSRSGEDIAEQSGYLTQLILVWTFAVFLFHSAVIYLCLFPQSIRRAWKEGAALVLSGAAVLIVMLVILPPDFVSNTVIENLLPERIPERIRSDAERGLPDRGSGRRTLPQGSGQRPELRGLSEHEWGGRTGRGGEGEDNRQYMVMIVASQREPLYMGNSFRGQLDPVRGFLLSPQEQLNDIVNQRLFVTWANNERIYDSGRQRQEIFSLSTLWQKYLPYFPVSADPVILSESSGPLRYIHQEVSDVHTGDPLELVNTLSRPLSERERITLAPYLELNLEAADMELFYTYLDNAISACHNNRQEIIQNDRYLQSIFNRETINRAGNEHLEKIIALLSSFNTFQYNLNYDENHSIDALKDFLFTYKEGDCVEFSNTLALLGRLAGIPSRVVTGYLAAESLQTIAHLRGIASLQAQIPALQQFPFENLYMVTNIHSHSWAQFYIPGYGWLDFEATSFAIPPAGMGDFNNWDVVIPLIDENRTFTQVRRFPWQAAGRTLLTLAIIALITAYILRYGRELILYIAAKQSSRKGARALYLLLLARLAADNQPIKPASKTASEYSQLFADKETPHFKNFANIYSQLRWRNFETQTDFDTHFTQLKKEYQNILTTTRKKGIHRWLLRIINLKGLAYL